MGAQKLTGDVLWEWWFLGGFWCGEDCTDTLVVKINSLRRRNRIQGSFRFQTPAVLIYFKAIVQLQRLYFIFFLSSSISVLGICFYFTRLFKIKLLFILLIGSETMLNSFFFFFSQWKHKKKPHLILSPPGFVPKSCWFTVAGSDRERGRLPMKEVSTILCDWGPVVDPAGANCFCWVWSAFDHAAVSMGTSK